MEIKLQDAIQEIKMLLIQMFRLSTIFKSKNFNVNLFIQMVK